MSKLAALVPTQSDDKLEQMYKNCLEILGNGSKQKNHDEAHTVLDAIKNEWARRCDLAKKGQYMANPPKEGLLARMRYHVGKDGVPTPLRRTILAQVVEGEIPPIPNPTYMDDWGDAGTEKRLQKLVNSLVFFVTDNMRFKDAARAKAIIEWQEDLDWLKTTYYKPRGYAFRWPAIPTYKE